MNKDKTKLNPGDAVIVTANFPKVGRYKHSFEIGQKVYLIFYIPFPSGELPQFSDNLSLDLTEQVRQVMELDHFELPSEA